MIDYERLAREVSALMHRMVPQEEWPSTHYVLVLGSTNGQGTLTVSSWRDPGDTGVFLRLMADKADLKEQIAMAERPKAQA